MSASDAAHPVPWAPCSDRSRSRADPMHGTASAGSRWLLLELSGAWGPSAFTDSPSIIAPTLGRAIAHRAEAAGLRIAAIRRPGRRSPLPRWRWFLAHCEPGLEALVGGETDGPEGYLEVPLDGSTGAPVSLLTAVCAHGRHDRCCAVRGRAATAAISNEFPETTWECSHLGGDRFAATMLILPAGLCYGRVDSHPEPSALVRSYLAGRLDNRLLRGRTALPHAVQAAQFYARETLGEDRIAALPPLGVRREEHRIEVDLATATGVVTVTLAEKLSEPLLSMCRATVAGRVRTFALVSLTVA